MSLFTPVYGTVYQLHAGAYSVVYFCCYQVHLFLLHRFLFLCSPLYILLLGDMLDQSISPIEFVQILFIYLFIYLFISSFCMNFVVKISQKRNQQSCSNFHIILAMIRNRPANKFSLITQPWHHPGAILCFHIIIHIFITIYQKLIKFDTHKLEVMGQYIDPSPSPCASQRARVRASKF